MKAVHICLIAAAALALPVAALAQSSSDYRYCTALSEKFQGFAPASARQQPNVNQAMVQCKEGQSTEAIPVLEAALHDAKLALPTRALPVQGVAKRPSR